MSVAGGTGGGGGMMKELICSLVSSREEPVRFGGGTATLARNESRSMFKTSLLSRSRKQENNKITSINFRICKYLKKFLQHNLY